MSKYALFAALALVTPAVADAAITQTFSDRPGFAALGPLVGLSLALPGSPPVFVASFASGPMTIKARDDLLAGDGFDIISTSLDEDVLVLDFEAPIFAIGLFGGVGGPDFSYIDGELDVEAVGSGAAAFSAAGGPAYFALISDTGFSQLRVWVRSFDSGASAIAFVNLQDRVDVAASVPEPATWGMMIAGFSALGLTARRRRGVRSVAA